jgi:hypothetical protein
VADQWGNVYIPGNTSGVLSGQNFGKFDAFITKLDSMGNMVWTKQIGTETDDRIADI